MYVSLPHRASVLVASHTRNRAWYAKDDFELVFDLAMDNLKKLTIPLPKFEDPQSPLLIFDVRGPCHPFPLLDILDLLDLKDKMWDQAEKIRNLDSLPLRPPKDTDLGLTGGVRDKKTTRMFPMCTKLRDFRLLDCALGNRFRVWG